LKREFRPIDQYGESYLSSSEYPSDIKQLEQQNNYGSLILAIGEGVDSHLGCTQLQKQCLKMNYITAIPFFEFIDNGIEDALQWLYPNGFNHDPDFLSSAILAATNKQVLLSKS
jgi:hypothetical protein